MVEAYGDIGPWCSGRESPFLQLLSAIGGRLLFSTTSVGLAIARTEEVYNTRCSASFGTHLCAWGNDAASEVIPRRVNCWLKTISKPPLWPTRATENFWKGSL
ncbi:hypothetical protein PR202_ga00622 [Eleusine coracana subsp. coracana]|uniref:Uncharacterized protein n=1 Tax=Eleusine coracana subsp. coracana TaxID=191504 RepID=A0AAV5BHX2_ELECO|nr:hypothetical protein PR202_ga00622 [Eleusine coracana subsp. coracana]